MKYKKWTKEEDAILYESLITKLQRLKREPFQDEGEISACTRELHRISEKISASLAEPLIYSKKLNFQLFAISKIVTSFTLHH